MARQFAAGIDIGSYQIKVVLAEAVVENNRQSVRIIGTGTAETKGLRHGYVINVAEASKSIRLAVRQAEKAAGLKVSHAYLAVGGIGLSAFISLGSLVTSRADSEISDSDMQRVVEISE